MRLSMRSALGPPPTWLRPAHHAPSTAAPPPSDVGCRALPLGRYFYADHVLTISDVDRAAIRASLTRDRSMQEVRFSTLRHVYADGVLFPLERRAPCAARRGMLFLGNLNNPTNLFGLRW